MSHELREKHLQTSMNCAVRSILQSSIQGGLACLIVSAGQGKPVWSSGPKLAHSTTPTRLSSTSTLLQQRCSSPSSTTTLTSQFCLPPNTVPCRCHPSESKMFPPGLAPLCTPCMVL